MPCVLEINSNGELKQGHMESSPLSTENTSSTAVPMATKRGRMVAHLDAHLPIKSNNLLIS